MRVGWHIPTLVALPWLIAALNPNWLFNPSDRLQIVDPMIYQGLFRYLFDFASTPPTNSHYFVERLGWVVPGYVLYHVAPPLVANILLHISFYTLSVIALYLAGRILFGANPAWFAAMCMGAYPWFLRAVGHDYLDGAGAAYFTVTLFFLAQAASRVDRNASLFAAGLGLGLMLLTHLSWAVFVPVLVLFYLGLAWPATPSRWLQYAGWIAGGLICMAVIAAVFSGLAFGRPIFLANSLGFANSVGTYRDILVADAYQVYGATLPTWHVLPLILALACCVWLIRSRNIAATIRRPVFTIAACWAAMYATFIVLHHVGAVPYLIIYLYMSYVIPLTFLMLAALAALAGPAFAVRSPWLALVFLAAPFGLTVVFPELTRTQNNAPLVIGASAILGATLVVAMWRKVGYSWLAVIFAVYCFAIGDGAGTYVADRNAYLSFFESTQFVISRLETHYPNQRNFNQFRLWWHQGAYAENAHAIAGIYQLLFRRSINDHPGEMLTVPEGPPLLSGDIVLFSDRPDAVQEAQQAVGDQVRFEVVDQFDVPYGSNPAFYQGYILRLQRHDRFDVPLLITGNNVGPVIRDEAGRDFAWTGPGENVSLNFNFDSRPNEPIFFDICALSSAQATDQILQARVAGQPFELHRVPARSGCTLMYEGQILAEDISSGTPTVVEIAIPTIAADAVLNNNDQTPLGMAIRYTVFETEASRARALALPLEVEASGVNISGLIRHDSGVDYAWTGPNEATVLNFQLPPLETSELVIELCALASIQSPAEQLDTLLNQAPLAFSLVEPRSECPILYRAVALASAISPTGVSTLAFSYPTGTADQAFHNGDTQRLGLAISYIRFEDPDDFRVELEARGQNLLSLESHQSGVQFAWTGPDPEVDVTLHSGPLPDIPLRLRICGLASILPAELSIRVIANSDPLTMKRIADTPECPILYETIVPAGAFGEQLKALHLFIPTAPADQAFHNGDQRPLGIAISYIVLQSVSHP